MSKFHKVPIDDLLAALERDDMVGFCLSCGIELMGIDSDTRNMECESCGENNVFGAYEVLIRVQA